jgi:trehalose-6-phosphate synthase
VDRLPAVNIERMCCRRDGLNLYPLEFTYVKQGERHPPGVVLASEFSACSSILNGALRVNPFDINSVSGFELPVSKEEEL